MGSRLVKSFPVVSALTGAGLCLVGLVRRVSQLHAAGVSVHHGVTQLSPADYFEQGVAVVARPAAILLLGVLGACAVGAFIVAHVAERARLDGNDSVRVELAMTVSEPWFRSTDRSPHDRPPRRRRVVRWCLRPVMVSSGGGFVAFFVPLAVWAPLVAGLVPLACLAWLNARHRLLDLSSWSVWSRAHARACVAALALTFAMMAGLHCYFDPPPLELVQIRTTQGKLLLGGLIAEANGSVYFSALSGQGHRAQIEVLPSSRIASMSIGDGHAQSHETIPELLGISWSRGLRV